MKMRYERTGPLAYSKGSHREPETGICGECGEECSSKFEDCSFDYEYGSISGVYCDGYEVSDCCGADIIEGGVSLVRRSVHVARKDHKDGKIKTGQKYRISVYRHWKKDGPSWIVTDKRVMAA
jgi:hypothetical protein